MWVYYSIFSTLLIITLIEFYKIDSIRYQRNRLVIFYIISFFLILFCGFRDVGISRDSYSYLQNFELIKSGESTKTEIGFKIISTLSENISTVFFYFAFIGVSIKALFIIKKLKFWGVAFLFYFSSYYIIQEFTQIRVGVASGLGLWSLYFIGEKKYSKAYLMIFLASLIHLSALLFIPIFFLSKKKVKSIYAIIFIISFIIAIIAPSLLISVLEKYLPAYFNYRVFFEGFGQINIFNGLALFQYFILIIIFINWKNLVTYSNSAIYYIKAYIIGLTYFLLFSTLPLLGYRAYELMLISQIPIFDMFLQKYKKRRWIIFFLLLYIFVYFYILIEYSTMLGPYSSKVLFLSE